VESLYCRNHHITDKNLVISPANSNIAVQIDNTSLYNEFYDLRIQGGASVGFDIDAVGCILERCFVSNPVAGGYSFDIGANSTKLFTCLTVGVSGVATTGFYFRPGIKGYVENCHSNQNSNGGFVIDSSVSNMIFNKCSSGAGDGVKVDNGTSNVWVDYHFDRLFD
jgi:hypothetical protein